MRKVSLWVVVVCAVAGLARGAETWVEVKSGSFTVVGNGGEGTARKTLNDFEQVRGAYARVWPWARLAQGKPIVILALKDESTMRRWAPGYFEVKGGINVVSARAYGHDRRYLLLRTDARPENVEVTPNYNLYRSYVSLLLSNSFERRLPFWLSNGLGQVLGNTRVQKDEIELGRPVPWELRYFNEHARVPLRTILDARADSPLAEKDDLRDAFDAQTYVLVHYLLFGDRGANAPKLTRFQQLWAAGRSHDQALAEAFGDLAALEAALVVYAARPVLSFARMPTEPKLDSVQTARMVPPAEIAALRASLHVALDRKADAQTALREARTLDPQSACSYDAEGLLADADSDEPRAQQAYDQAAQLGSTSAHTYYRAAQLAWKAQLDSATLQKIQQRLEKAIELSAADARAYSFLAEILAEQDKAQEALVPAQRAVELEPGASYHRIALGRVLAELDRLDEAAKTAAIGLQLADNGADRSNAERFILYLNDKKRFVQDRAKQDSSRACQGGDATACARMLPDLERDCDGGQTQVCTFLAYLYAQGNGVAKDGDKAVGYLEKACAKGDDDACVEQAWTLGQRRGVAKDEAKAFAILEGLCSHHAPACKRLALLELGKPDAASRKKAKARLTEACQGGDQEACSLAKQVR